MLSARGWLFVALGAFSLFYLWIWFRGKGRAPGVPSPLELFIGFITNFFDTLGIGSFAPTTAIFRRWRLVADEEIPGTLHAGHTIPSILQAFIFTKLVNVVVLSVEL